MMVKVLPYGMRSKILTSILTRFLHELNQHHPLQSTAKLVIKPAGMPTVPAIFTTVFKLTPMV
jgi:hypothetical protein